jgi:hypothetical protein
MEWKHRFGRITDPRLFYLAPRRQLQRARIFYLSAQGLCATHEQTSRSIDYSISTHENSCQILRYSICTHTLADARTAKVHDRTDILSTRTGKVDRSAAILSARASSQTRIVSSLHKHTSPLQYSTPSLLPEPSSRSECRYRRARQSGRLRRDQTRTTFQLRTLPVSRWSQA